MNHFSHWASETSQRIENALDLALPHASTTPQRLHQAMRYAVLNGGKRIRPLLVHATGALTDAPLAALDSAACALEMIHVYSLVHDDLPAMDDDDLRRGKPTVHKAYDEATAILVGDALQAQAFLHLSQNPNLKAAQCVALIKELAQAAGSIGMVGGQMVDLESIGMQLTQTQLAAMHSMKTGALLRAAVRMGLACNEALPMDTLDHYAANIGLAFQLVDDILDATAPTSVLGKTAGKDAADGKPTYVSMLGLETARTLAQTLCTEAQAILKKLPGNSAYLYDLAHLIVQRTY